MLLHGRAGSSEVQGKGQFAGLPWLQRVARQAGDRATTGRLGWFEFEDVIPDVLELEHARNGLDLRGLAKVIGGPVKLELGSARRKGRDAHGTSPKGSG